MNRIWKRLSNKEIKWMTKIYLKYLVIKKSLKKNGKLIILKKKKNY